MTKEERIERPIEHAVRVIQSCRNLEQVKSAETYSLLAGVRLHPTVNEVLETMKQTFKGL